MTVLFRFGVVVMFGLSSVEKAVFLSGLAPYINEPFQDLEVEEVTIRIEPDGDESVASSSTVRQNLDITKLQIIANALAKSVVLG